MPSVIVVVGGIIGCSTAYYLARQGVSVTVIERGEVAGEASSAAAGILASLSDHGEHPAFFDRLCDQSLQLYDELLPALNETGIDVRHRRIGILDLALTEGEVPDLKQLFERRRSLKPLSWLDAAEARRLEPQISPRTTAAVLTPEVQYLDPQRLTQAIASAARRAGVTICEQEPVTRFVRRGDRLFGVRTSGGTYEADSIVLAGGPWTTEMAQRLGDRVPVRPYADRCCHWMGRPLS
jgi:glycine oxidase